MANYTIKKLTSEDVTQLQEVSRLTFSETFGADNTSEDLKEYLDKAYDTPKLINELKNKNSYFFFLMVKDEVAGYLKLNEKDAQTEKMGDDALEIERIYLKNAFQHQGLGVILIKHAIKFALENHKKRIWLGVWEHNYNAQKFYHKFGFKGVSQHTFMVGEDAQTDFILVKELDSKFSFKTIDEMSGREAFCVERLRNEVFVAEQKITLPEIDNEDFHAVQVFLLNENRTNALATCRIFKNADGDWILGRVVVAKSMRKKNLGFELISAVHNYLRKKRVSKISCHAQMPVKDFYEKLGYQAIGETFDEGGIDHIRMVKNLI